MIEDDAADDGGDACRAAALFAIDPPALGGVLLRARTGPVRDAWLALLRNLLPDTASLRRLPLSIADDRLLGGLDLGASLSAGRPVAERGVLAESDGGVLVLASAERVSGGLAARLAMVLDRGEVILEREGVARRLAARLGLVALDEGVADEVVPAGLTDRLAFCVDLNGLDRLGDGHVRADVDAARASLPGVTCEAEVVAQVCEMSAVLGVASLRAALFTIRAAKALAALNGRATVTMEDVVVVARLVLGPRATRIPAPPPEAKPPEQSEPDPAPTESPPPPDGESDNETPPPPDGESEDQTPPPTRASSDQDMMVDAARAAIPSGLLARLEAAMQRSSMPSAPGKSGAARLSPRRGRPAGIRRGLPRGGARLNLIETLRAAAPWQRLRRAGEDRTRIEVRADDFRVTRFKQRSETVTLFVVDASGSLALNRLAEAKGAVELLLKDCYVRRDQVALMAFRGKGTDLLLPPTRSLVRAKRALASLPGGGATPLAAAMDAALQLGEQIRRRGQTPVLVFLTDGRANVARDGSGGRAAAEADALTGARLIRASGIRTLVIDAAQRPQPSARSLAADMGALYLPLPRADAVALSAVVKAAAA